VICRVKCSSTYQLPWHVERMIRALKCMKCPMMVFTKPQKHPLNVYQLRKANWEVMLSFPSEKIYKHWQPNFKWSVQWKIILNTGSELQITDLFLFRKTVKIRHTHSLIVSSVGLPVMNGSNEQRTEREDERHVCPTTLEWVKRKCEYYSLWHG
jgi:hypothetical protein